MAYYNAGPLGAISEALVQGASAYENAKAMRREKEEKQALLKAEEGRKEREMTIREQQAQVNRQNAEREAEAYRYGVSQRGEAEKFNKLRMEQEELKLQEEKDKAAKEKKYDAWSEIAKDISIFKDLESANKRIKELVPGMTITGVENAPNGEQYVNMKHVQDVTDEKGNITQKEDVRKVAMSDLKEMTRGRKESAIYDQKAAQNEFARTKWKENLDFQHKKLRAQLDKTQQEKLTVYDKRVRDLTEVYVNDGYPVDESRRMAISDVAKHRDAPDTKDLLRMLQTQRTAAVNMNSAEGDERVKVLDEKISELTTYETRRYDSSREKKKALKAKRPAPQAAVPQQRPTGGAKLMPWEKPY